MTEARYYTKNEIETICSTNDITIIEFIQNIILESDSKESTKELFEYQHVISTEESKLWIGKVPLSDEFADKNIDLIYEYANNIVNNHIEHEYKKEDAIQELVVYTLQNCGDIEKNFEENEDFCKDMIYNRMNNKLLQKNILKNEKLELGELCIIRLKNLTEEGKDKKTALAKVEKEFNLSKEDLLEIMTNYIDNTKKHKEEAEER